MAEFKSEIRDGCGSIGTCPFPWRMAWYCAPMYIRPLGDGTSNRP